MKKLILIAISIAFMSSGNYSYAQVTLKGGLNFSNWRYSELEKEEGVKYSVFKPGFHFGLTYSLFFSERFSLEPALIFNTRGNTLKMSEESTSLVSKVNMNYLDIPIIANYFFDMEDGKNLFIGLGPYLGFALGGQSKTTLTFFGDSETQTEKIDFDESINRFDLGLILNVGMNFKRLQTSLSYELGLGNLVTTDGNGGIYNNNLKLTVGYRLFDQAN